MVKAAKIDRHVVTRLPDGSDLPDVAVFGEHEHVDVSGVMDTCRCDT